MQEIVTLAESPREFYWALMDYGTWLKKQGIRNTAQSAHYTKQTPFKGSMRQIRGEVLRRAQQKQRIEKIRDEIDDIRFDAVIDALTCEGFIEIRNGRIFIVSS
jgi:A/G-specific adenine glycosylase